MLDWTGERYIPYIDPSICGAQVHYEHLHRYAFVSHLIKDKTVLDLASGEGYGTFILSKNAKFVIGIEIDRDTVCHALSTYKKNNLEFIQGSILNIPLNSEKKFDVIICFEAIEHIEDQNALFHEIKRMLRDDGLLIISTPNKQIYTDDSGYQNPYHKKELYCSEFLDLLKNNFSHIYLFGQKVIMGSSIYPLSSKNISSYNEFIIEQEDHRFSFKENTDLNPLYFVAIASMIGLEENKIQKSYLIDKSNTIISLLQTQLSQCNTSIQSLEQLIAAKNLQVQHINEHAKGLGQLLDDRKKEISDLTTQYQLANAKIISLEKNLIYQKNQIATLNKDLNNMILHAQGLEQLLAHRDNAIAVLSNQVQQVTLHAQGLEQIIKENCYNYWLSTHFGLTERIIDISYYLFNICRNSCKLGLKAIDILSHEGLRGLLKHYNDRKYIKKFENNKHKIQSFGKKDIIPIEKIDIKKILLPENNEKPEVSIIIPVYNNVLYTLNCIRSISLNTTGPYEIIVVDDASNDITPELLKGINNLTIIKNEQNRGFIRSCNIGASASKGNYILFLNNDTLVTESWLPPLLEIIKKENVGAVGAKLVYPDGKLQEAGAIIWNEGSGWNFGRGDNPEKPEYNFVREVDYCSGAALLVKREIFEKTGGFDERYIPAYYEDADLCFSIRKLGYKVIYQPKSVIIHFEGISNGSDLKKGIKQNQIINKDKFFQKWKEVLQNENLNPSPRNLILARSRSSGKNILVIDQYVPFFDRDAGSYRMSNILKILAELGHRVTFIGENFNQFEPYDSIMQQAGVEVIFSPFIRSIKQYISQYGHYFDVVILSRPHIAQKNISNIRKYCSNAKVVFDTVDLQFLRESRRAKVINDPVLLKKADELKKMEIQLAKSSDVTLVVSTKEYEILTSEDPSLNVQIISLIHELKKPDKTFSERRDLLFLGAFLHNPNVDGVIWFIKEIFPKIKSKIPDIKLFVVGDRPTKEVLSFSSEDIIVTGYVEDLTGYFNDSRVFVAPLRYGAGVKGKINQSMSHGLPVITTHIGAEGMDLTDEHNILIADDPDTFAKKVIQLYQDEELWSKLSINSTEHIRQNFSYEYSKKRIKQFIDSL